MRGSEGGCWGVGGVGEVRLGSAHMQVEPSGRWGRLILVTPVEIIHELLSCSFHSVDQDSSSCLACS